jgi:hypothetical protein
VRILADESTDFLYVRRLREVGHDVTAIAEVSSGLEDRAVAQQAATLGCLLLTEDKDFGQLVHAQGRGAVGVILLRYPAAARHHMAAALTELLERRGQNLVGCFVVLQPGRVRITHLP